MTDLARLVVALEAQSAKYQAELDRANKKLSRFEGDTKRSLGRIDAGFKRFGRGVGNIVAGIFAGFTIQGVIDATREAEDALALLDNAVQATGGSAGYTTSQLADMAGELMRVSTFSDEAIMGAQQLLLRFQSIQGVRFERALDSALDLATVLRMDLASAATLVGKALEDPEKGIAQLTRRGVTFTAEQQKVIKALVDTGRAADAQTLILDSLEKKFGGAAEAASETFGGALTRLKNTAGELLEAKSGLPAVTDSINNLTDKLQDPQLVDGLDRLASGLLRIGAIAVEGAAEFGAFGEVLGRWQADAFGNLSAMDELEGKLRDIDRALNNSILGRPVKFLTKNREELQAMRKEVEAQIAALEKASGFSGFGPARPKPGATTPVTPDDPIVVPVELEVITPAGEKIAKSSGFDMWLEQLDDQTKTALDKQLDFLNEFEANLGILLEEGVISPEQYAERWGEALDSVLQEVEPAGERIGDKLMKQFEKVSVFMEQAFRNTTDIIAGFFESAMGGSFDNVLDDFLKMINAMVAQALAARIGEWLFGAKGGGGGALDSAFGFLGGLIGRDSGGRGKKGQAYAIGRGAQPEVFVPDEPGNFYPADQWMGRGGGGRVQQNIYLQGRPDQRTARQMALEAARLQRTANARLG